MNDKLTFTPLETLVITAICTGAMLVGIFILSRFWVMAGKPGRTIEVPKTGIETHNGHRWIHHPDCKCHTQP